MHGSGFSVRGFGVQGSGFGVQGSGCRVQGRGHGAAGVGIQRRMLQVLGFRVYCSGMERFSGIWVSGPGFRVPGKSRIRILSIRVSGTESEGERTASGDNGGPLSFSWKTPPPASSGAPAVSFGVSSFGFQISGFGFGLRVSGFGIRVLRCRVRISVLGY